MRSEVGKYIIIKKGVVVDQFRREGHFKDTRYATITDFTNCFGKVKQNENEFKVKKRSDEQIFNTEIRAKNTCKKENKKGLKSDFVFDFSKVYIKAKVLKSVNLGTKNKPNYQTQETIIEGENINDEIKEFRVIDALTKEDLKKRDLTIEELNENELERKRLGSEGTRLKNKRNKLGDKIKFGYYSQNEKDMMRQAADEKKEQQQVILDKINELSGEVK